MMEHFHPINFITYKSNNNKNILSKLNIVDNDKIFKLSKNYECFNFKNVVKIFLFKYMV